MNYRSILFLNVKLIFIFISINKIKCDIGNNLQVKEDRCLKEYFLINFVFLDNNTNAVLKLKIKNPYNNTYCEVELDIYCYLKNCNGTTSDNYIEDLLKDETQKKAICNEIIKELTKVFITSNLLENLRKKDKLELNDFLEQEYNFEIGNLEAITVVNQATLNDFSLKIAYYNNKKFDTHYYNGNDIKEQIYYSFANNGVFVGRNDCNIKKLDKTYEKDAKTKKINIILLYGIQIYEIQNKDDTSNKFKLVRCENLKISIPKKVSSSFYKKNKDKKVSFNTIEISEYEKNSELVEISRNKEIKKPVGNTEKKNWIEADNNKKPGPLEIRRKIRSYKKLIEDREKLIEDREKLIEDREKLRKYEEIMKLKKHTPCCTCCKCCTKR